MYPQKGICLQEGVSAWHGILKARANTWAAVAEPQIPRIWGIWVGTAPCPLPLWCADQLCLLPLHSLPQEKDAEAGFKIESLPPEDGERSIRLGRGLLGGCFLGRVRGISGVSGATRGCWWGGDRSPHNGRTPPLKRGLLEGMWLHSSR